MNDMNSYIRDFLRHRNIESTPPNEEGHVVLVFDRKYRVRLVPIAHDRIVLTSFVCFLPTQDDKREYLVQKTLKVMQANLFTSQAVLFIDDLQHSVCAQLDLFDIESFIELEIALENFLNALDFYREILK